MRATASARGSASSSYAAAWASAGPGRITRSHITGRDGLDPRVDQRAAPAREVLSETESPGDEPDTTENCYVLPVSRPCQYVVFHKLCFPLYGSKDAATRVRVAERRGRPQSHCYAYSSWQAVSPSSLKRAAATTGARMSTCRAGISVPSHKSGSKLCFKALGARFVERELELDEAFRSDEISISQIESMTAEIHRLEGRLRAAHLSAHVETTDVLSTDQVRRYDELRGYTAADGSEPRHEPEHHHAPEEGGPPEQHHGPDGHDAPHDHGDHERLHDH